MGGLTKRAWETIRDGWWVTRVVEGGLAPEKKGGGSGETLQNKKLLCPGLAGGRVRCAQLAVRRLQLGRCIAVGVAWWGSWEPRVLLWYMHAWVGAGATYGQANIALFCSGGMQGILVQGHSGWVLCNWVVLQRRYCQPCAGSSVTPALAAAPPPPRPPALWPSGSWGHSSRLRQRPLPLPPPPPPPQKTAAA